MSKDDDVYLGHMLDKTREALDLVSGKTRSDFNRDKALRLALAHLVQIIGEAARQVTREFKNAHPELPWREIIGMRHKVVHDYMDLDEDVVWAVAPHDIRYFGLFMSP